MKVMLAMSGGVDSSVAGALLLDAGHDVVGVTMRLWGGDSDTGCCSVSDVDDARRVAQQLGIDHLVFNFGDEFDRHVVDPYVEAHRVGATPNPCIECNRHVKFDRLAARAHLLGFDAIATGHHARVVRSDAGRFELLRGADRAKDQSYVVHVLDQAQLARTLFPVGDLTKSVVREIAATRGLRTAAKPDSQDVCFVTRAGREVFLGSRIPLRPAPVVDTDGVVVGRVPAIELVTLGQRRGLGLPGGGPKRYVVEVDRTAHRVVVAGERDLLVERVSLASMSWTEVPRDGPVLAQCSAHGESRPALVLLHAGARTVRLEFATPQPVVAPGQSVVLYDLDDQRVLGGGVVVSRPEGDAGLPQRGTDPVGSG